MGDIKITDIKKQFRTIAENIDKVENGGNGNKMLDGEEISVFKKHAAIAGATEKDFEKMGLAIEKEADKAAVKTVTNPQVQQKAEVHSKYEQSNINKRVKNAVKELVRHGATKEGLIGELTEKYAKVQDGKKITDESGKIVVQEGFAQAIEEIKAVLNSVDVDKVTTEKEAKEAAKQAKKAFPKATEVQEIIIDKIQDWAEATATSKRLDTLRKMYNDKLGSDHNYEIALNALEKDLKTSKEWKKDYTKDAFKILEKDAKQMALFYVRTTLNTKVADVDAEIARVQSDTEMSEEDKQKTLEQLAKDRQVAVDIAAAEKKSGVRKALDKANTEKDGFLEDAYEKRLAGRRDKTVKHDMEQVARENTSDHKVEATMVEVVDPQTGEKKMVSQMSADAITKDIKKRVNGNTFWHGVGQYTLISGMTNISSKNAEKLVSKLKGNTDYYDPKTNTFNLEAIRRDVNTDIGDLVLDAEDDRIISEIENLRKHMNARMNLTGKDEINTSEARALVKLVEGDIKHADWRKAGAAGAVSSVGAAIAGLVGGLLAKHGKLEVNQRVDLVIDNLKCFNDICSQLDEIKKKVPEFSYTTTDLTAGKKGIHIAQQVIKGDKQFINALTGILNGMAIGAATGILTALIVGGEKKEDSCMPIGDYDVHNTRYTDPAQYKEYIGNRYAHNPVKVAAIQAIVDRYVDFYGDTWHVEFQNDMRQAAGLGSKMNPNECMKFFSQKKYVKPGNVVPQTQEQNNTPEKEKITKSKTTKCDPKNVDYIANAARYGWPQVNKIYSCFNGMRDELATRMMKVIQAIDPDKVNGIYEIERIQEIALKTMTRNYGNLPDSKIREALKAYPEVNADTFIAVVHARYVGNSKAIDKENKLTTPLRLYERDENGELKVACERDLSKLIRPKRTNGRTSNYNNVNAKLNYNHCEDKYKVNGKPVDKKTYDNTVSNDRVTVEEVEWTD